MNNPTSDESTITCEVVQVFRIEKMDDHNRRELRVVKWSGGKERVLEKRHVWSMKDGTLRYRKSIGLSQDDINFIVNHQQEIITALTGAKDGDHKSSDTILAIHPSQQVCEVGRRQGA